MAFVALNDPSAPIENVIAKSLDDSGYKKCSGEIKTHFKIETPATVTTPLRMAENDDEIEAQNQDMEANGLSTLCKPLIRHRKIAGICLFVVLAAAVGLGLYISRSNDPVKKEQESETQPDDVQKIPNLIISEVSSGIIENLRRRKPGYSLSFQASGLSPRDIYDIFDAMKDGVVVLTIDFDIFLETQETCVDMSGYLDSDSIIEMINVKNITILRPNVCFFQSNVAQFLTFTKKLQNAEIGIGDDPIIRKMTVWLNESSPGVAINST